MQTPLEVLIEWMDNENAAYIKDYGFHESYAINECIDKAKSLLPTERQIIIDSHSHGIRFMAGDTTIPQDVSEHYFNQTFKTEQP